MANLSNHAAVSSTSAAYWFQFFLDAGIPPADAGNYAVTFTENRIKEDMLNDLSKDYLHDMGISVMGDTIAILKHSKLVHSQSTRDKVLRGSNLNATFALASVTAIAPGNLMRESAVRATAPVQAKPTYNAVVEKPVVAKAGVAVASKQPVVVPKLAMTAKAPPTVNKPPQPAERISVTAPMAARIQPRADESRTRAAEPTAAQKAGAGVVRLKPAVREEVPVPKSRSVAPHQEGAYKITLPSGKTEKTRKILEQQAAVRKASAASEGGVFSRLGKEADSDDSSFSDSDAEELLVQQGSPVVRLTASARDTSIFSRLGGKVTTTTKRLASEMERSGSATGTKQAVAPPPVKTTKIVPITMSRPVPITMSRPITTTPKTPSYTQRSEGIFGSGAEARGAESKTARSRLGAKLSASAVGRVSAGGVDKAKGSQAQKAVVSSTTPEMPMKIKADRMSAAGSVGGYVRAQGRQSSSGGVFSRLGKARNE